MINSSVKIKMEKVNDNYASALDSLAKGRMDCVVTSLQLACYQSLQAYLLQVDDHDRSEEHAEQIVNYLLAEDKLPKELVRAYVDLIEYRKAAVMSQHRISHEDTVNILPLAYKFIKIIESLIDEVVSVHAHE